MVDGLLWRSLLLGLWNFGLLLLGRFRVPSSQGTFVIAIACGVLTPTNPSRLEHHSATMQCPTLGFILATSMDPKCSTKGLAILDSTLFPKVAGIALASAALAAFSLRLATVDIMFFDNLNFVRAFCGEIGWAQRWICRSSPCRPCTLASRSVDGGMTSHASNSPMDGEHKRRRTQRG